MEERDPSKSRAMESSLWELHTLQSHVLPGVSTAANFIYNPLPSVEWDLSQILEETSDDVSLQVFDRPFNVYSISILSLHVVFVLIMYFFLLNQDYILFQIFEREMKKKLKEIALTFDRPQSLSLPQHERVSQFWQLV